MELPATATRVAENSDPSLNEKIRETTDERIRAMETASPTRLSQHLDTLEREWDMERKLQANAATLALAGSLLGGLVSRKWFVFPGVIYGFLMQHALQGWCPPVPALRKMGTRTVQEIERERYAIKAIRGDLEGLPAKASARVEAVIEAVDKR